MMRRCFILWLSTVLVLLSGPAAAETSSAATDTTAADTPAPLPVELDEEFFDKLDALTCTDLNAFAYREIPRFVLSDRPDLLYEFVLYWKSRCLNTEPVFRTILLGSIWDAGFDEGQYDEGVIDHLIDRYDPPVQSKFPDLRKKFDGFSTNFADQLLPHVPHHGLEEFFCLFYAGKTAEAWALLESEDLEDTWLRYYYDEEMAELTKSNAVPTFALTGGGWWPQGNVEFAGDKPLMGMLAGVRWPHWLMRFVFEVRVGRTTRPYWVDENDLFGRSNRFDAVFFGGEFGRILFQRGRNNLDLFVGVGFDGVKPFKDEDIMLGTINGNVGLGYRLFLGKNRNWVLGADVRHEWIGERNENADSMSGRAWSARFSAGFAFNEGKARRLKGLGH
jgi:hypothetical protein